MRKLEKPSLDPLTLFDSCLAGVPGADRARIATARQFVQEIAAAYESQASTGALCSISPRAAGANALVAGLATGQDFVSLYERHMVPRAKPARTHYDDLLLLRSPRCPYCALGHSSTLDHYLPKSRYPDFSVTPCNLVPACRDCQSKKGFRIALSPSLQTLHPYFDGGHFVTETWLVAAIHPGTPFSATFNADPPNHWSAIDQDRVRQHVEQHALASRFAIESASELAILRTLNRSHRASGQTDLIRASLEAQRDANIAIHRNSWQSALYSALAVNTTYINAAEV